MCTFNTCSWNKTYISPYSGIHFVSRIKMSHGYSCCSRKSCKLSPTIPCMRKIKKPSLQNFQAFLLALSLGLINCMLIINAQFTSITKVFWYASYILNTPWCTFIYTYIINKRIRAEPVHTYLSTVDTTLVLKWWSSNMSCWVWPFSHWWIFHLLQVFTFTQTWTPPRCTM